MDEKIYKMELTREQVEWVINRDKILNHMYLNRDKHWMPNLYPDHVYKTGGYEESVWSELKKQVDV